MQHKATENVTEHTEDEMEVRGGEKSKGSPLRGPGLETDSAGSLREHKDGGGLGGQAPTFGLPRREGGVRGRGVRQGERGELKL